MPDTPPLPQHPFPRMYALIWRASKPDAEFDHAGFEARLPRLMLWLRELHAGGWLVACGGGGFEHSAGGLTIVRARDVHHACELSDGTPMNEIGTTEVLEWDVFFGKMDHTERAAKLQ